MKNKVVVAVLVAISLCFLTYDLFAQEKYEKNEGWISRRVFGDDKFSPKGDMEAFIIQIADGGSDWLCLLNLEKQTFIKLDDSNHGNFDKINWSPDGKFIALEVTLASGLRTIHVINVNSKKSILMTRTTRQREVEIFSPVWSKDSKTLKFKYKDIDDTEEIILEFDVKTKRLRLLEGFGTGVKN